ncbi:MAG TPA: hypothetical protein VFU48_04770 [Nitrospira sp.]|nr:hypothetical protein [Nitrospira sp.]
MNKRLHFLPSKKPVTYWFSKVGCAANALLRMLARFEWFRPWHVIVSISRHQNHDGDAQSSLIPIRIPIDRPRYR